jgi:ABC-type sugar transport system permease subunit
MPFEVFNVEVDTLKIVYIFIAAVFCIALVASALNYFSVKGVKYGLYKNRLKIYRTAFFLLLSSKEVSYENVFRVTYNNKGFFNKLFKSGCVVLELSGTKNKEAKLEFIDNPLKVSEYIQKLIQNYRQMQQAVFDERHKIESILDQV